MASCVIGLIKYPEMNVNYRPFFFACFADLVTEMLVYCLISRRIIPYPVSNMYVLISSLIFLWQFQQWGVFAKKRRLFQMLIGFQIALWLSEHTLFNSITSLTPYYRIESSFLLVILSVSTLNRHLTHHKGSVLKNAQFVICAALIVFFTYNIFVEIIYLKTSSDSFIQNRVFDIKRYINVFANLLFAYAMLWVPVKKKYTMLY